AGNPAATLDGLVQDARIRAPHVGDRVDLAAPADVEQEAEVEVLVRELVAPATEPVGVVVAHDDVRRRRPQRHTIAADDDAALRVTHVAVADDLAERLALACPDVAVPLRTELDAVHALGEVD